MKLDRLVKAAILACVMAACVCVIAACSEGTNGVAATVNGTEIMEQDVTDQIQHTRAQSGLDDEERWGKYLAQNDLTPDSVRSTRIDIMTEKELIKQGAADLDITVEESDVDEAVNKFKENYSTDEAWQKALKQANFTEESYRKTIEQDMYEKKIGEYFDEQEVEITDEDYLTQAKAYASNYNDAKRVSKIVFAVEDTSDTEAMDAAKEKADALLAQINAGSIDFADAAKQNSDDSESAEKGGDIGWDKLATLDEEYTTALTDLEVGSVSDPFKTSEGYVIVKVTDKYTAPSEDEITSITDLPEDFQNPIKEMTASVKANTLYTEWLDKLKEDADIHVNDMPKGLPYDVDVEKYKTESDAAADTDAASTEDAATAEADAAAADPGATPDATATPSDATATTTASESTSSASGE